MSAYIQVEVGLAMKSFLLGVFLMVIYDGLRLLRLLVAHGKLWTGLEDFFYWIYSAAMTFSLLHRQNDGVLRGYVIVSVFLGMFLYDRIVSSRVFGLLKKIGKWIKMKKKRRIQKREVRKNEDSKPRKTKSQDDKAGLG